MEPFPLHQSVLLSCLDSVEEAVIVTESAASPDAQPTIVYVNAYFERLTGYAKSEALGRTFNLLTGPSTDDAQVKKLCRALRSGDSFRSPSVVTERMAKSSNGVGR